MKRKNIDSGGGWWVYWCGANDECGVIYAGGCGGSISAHKCRGIMHGSQKQNGARWLGIGIRKGGDSDEAVAGWVVGVTDGLQRRRKEFSS